jgi:YVTN family beta-propeller protein
MKQRCRFSFVLSALLLLLTLPVQAEISMFLESPAPNQPVSGIGPISGWAYSTVPGAQITARLLVNGTVVGDIPCCVPRADVAERFGPQALNSGFGQVIHFNLLPASSTIAVEVSDTAGSAPQRREAKVTVIKPGGFQFLSQLDLLFATKIEFKNDRKEIAIEGVTAREKGTGNAQEVTIRVAWQENTQTLGIVRSENTGPTTTAQSAAGQESVPLQEVTAATESSLQVMLENPPDKRTVNGLGIVSGWTFPTAAGATITRLQLRVDETPVIDIPCCFERADVLANFPAHPQALRSGFGFPLNFNRLASGAHAIGVEVQDSTGASQTIDHQVTVVKPGNFEFLDLFDLSEADASIVGGTLELEKVKIRDKASRQTRQVNVTYVWQESCQCFVAQATCGNGSVEPGEECDGSTFGGATCETLGFSGGTLGCSDTCTFVTQECLGGPRVYVTNVKSNSVSVIDTATNTVVGTPVPVGKEPRGIAISPDGTAAYVSNFRDDTISVIDTNTNTVTNTIPLRTGQARKGPQGIAVAPDGATVYVVNGFDNSVSVIDAASKSVIANVAVGQEPQAIAFTPDGARAYVTNFAVDSVTVLDTSTLPPGVAGTVLVEDGPNGIAVAPDGTTVYVANFGRRDQGGGNSISIIGTATNTIVGEPLFVGFQPTQVVFSPDGTRAYVTNFLGSTISTIDTAATSVLSQIRAAGDPNGVVLTLQGKRMYVALFGRDGRGEFIQVISPTTNATLAFIQVGKGPFAVAATPSR